MGKLRVLIISPEYPPVVGGGSTYAAELAKGLIQQGASVTVITSGNSDEVTTEANTTVYRCESLYESLSLLSVSARMIDDITNIIKLVRPDVVHAHHTAAVMACEIIASCYPFARVYTQHRTPEWPDSYVKLDGKGMMATEVMKMSSVTSSISWIAPSKFFARRLIGGGVQPASITIITPAINSSLYRPRKGGNAVLPQQPYVFIPAVDRPRKDIAFTLEALANTGVAVFVTGVRSGPDLERLQAKFQATPIIPHLFIQDEQMPSLYCGSVAVVMSSTHEGFGLAAVEALSSGALVFVRTSPGLEEVASLSPLVSTYSNHEELRALVLGAKRQTFEKMLARHEDTKKRFSKSVQALQHIDVYNKAMQHDFSAGGVCFCQNGDQLFVRLTVSKNGHNNIPKGHLKENESWLDAARREIHEETGVECYGQGYETDEVTYDFKKDGVSIKKTVKFFTFIQPTLDAGSLAIEDGESVVSAVWLPYDTALAAVEYESERLTLKKAREIYDKVSETRNGN